MIPSKDILLNEWDVDRYEIDSKGTIVVHISASDGSVWQDTYTWDVESQTFVFKAVSQSNLIQKIEQNLFQDPASVIPLLQALLAGEIREAPAESGAPPEPPRYRPYLLYLLGLAYELTGDKSSAVHSYWQLWHDYPENPYALIAQRKLLEWP